METKKIKPRSTQNVKKKRADEKSARKNKYRAIKNLIKWTILLAMVLGILFFLVTSDLFGICNVEIAGNEQVSTEEIIALSKIQLSDNIFLCNTSKAIGNIKENAYIKDAKIKRIMPDKLKIEITEKKKTYMLEIDGEYVYIDEQGYILEKSANKIDKPELVGYVTPKEYIVVGERLNEEDLERLGDMLKITNNCREISIEDKIAKIDIKNKNDYIIYLAGLEKILYIGDSANLANKMLYVNAILQKEEGKQGKIFVNGKLNKGFEPYFREEVNN